MSTIRSTSRVEQGRISTAIIDAIAAFEGVDPVDLVTPLAEVVDTDALDALFPPAGGTNVCHLVFRYGAYEVSIDRDGDVLVTDAPDTAAY